VSIVTLTTDFGTGDGYVGAMKGVILQRAPAARVVDIAHDIEPHNVAAGAYCLCQAAPYFPDGTIHVAVIDPGVGTALRKPVIIDNGGQWYIGPDNGLFSLVAPSPRAVYAIEDAAFMRPQVSSTFHGRDIFAAAAGALAAGVPAHQAGAAVSLRGRLTLGTPRNLDAMPAGTSVATVVYIDHFGNLITDLSRSDLPPSAKFRVGEYVIERLSATYGDVAAGELVAYIGSADTLEIGVREDHAARTLGLSRGAHIEILAS
jgi:S-adenosyl-L-methionine hydrolase (adenosine-forming)